MKIKLTKQVFEWPVGSILEGPIDQMKMLIWSNQAVEYKGKDSVTTIEQITSGPGRQAPAQPKKTAKRKPEVTRSNKAIFDSDNK